MQAGCSHGSPQQDPLQRSGHRPSPVDGPGPPHIPGPGWKCLRSKPSLGSHPSCALCRATLPQSRISPPLPRFGGAQLLSQLKVPPASAPSLLTLFVTMAPEHILNECLILLAQTVSLHHEAFPRSASCGEQTSGDIGCQQQVPQAGVKNNVYFTTTQKKNPL